MIRRTPRLLTALGLMAVAVSGCNPRDAGNLALDTKRMAEDTSQALGSATLAGKVSGVLSITKGVDMSGLHIEAQDGVVTISGHVRTADEKHRILRMVNQIRGVDKAVLKLTIEGK